MNSQGYNGDASSGAGVGSSSGIDTITPADSITDIIQSSPYDKRAGEHLYIVEQVEPNGLSHDSIRHSLCKEHSEGNKLRAA